MFGEKATETVQLALIASVAPQVVPTTLNISASLPDKVKAAVGALV
jgi:hypothetical protein